MRQGFPPYQAAVQITAGTNLRSPGRGVFIAATVAGTVRLVLSSGTTLDVPVAVGASLIDHIEVIGVSAAGTTATAVVSALS